MDAIIKLFFTSLVSLTLLAHPAFAAKTTLERVNLPYGISLDVPSHWTVISMAERKNLAATSQAMMDNAGLESPSGDKESLLAMNATPSPTGAMIRVSVTTPAPYGQEDVAALASSPAELEFVGVEMFKMMKQLEGQGAPKFLEMQDVRVESLNNHGALVLPYVRADKFGPSPWQVTQYKIPVANHLIEITLSHRLSDAAQWKPILDRVKNSIQF